MEQIFRLLFVGLLGGLWLSLEEANCQDLDKGITTTSYCYNTSSGKTCFTTFLANGSHPVLKPFQTARNWCNSTVPGSSLIIINSQESQRTVESFIGRQGLTNETIITDAQKLSSRDRTKWSWVNGHPTIPMNVSAEYLPGLDGACVESKHGQSLTYCTGLHKSQHRYICEYSDSKSAFSYRHNSKYYVASEHVATWYNARKECLRLGGDLASITDLETIKDWSRMEENQGHKYWIGLHRNKWICNSIGAALTYTNWEDGYSDESSDNQCICIDPECKRECNGTTCAVDRKWRTCNCNHNYTIVCQKKESSDALTTEIVATEEMLPSTSTTRRRSAIRYTTPAITTTNSTKSPIAPTPVTPSTTASTPSLKPGISSVTTYITTNADIDRKTASTSSMTQNPSNHFTENQTPAFASSSTGLFNSFGTKETLLVLLLLAAPAFIIVAVILIIRKRKYARRNEASQLKKTDQKEADSPEYETMVRNKRPSDDALPIYTGLELTQHPMPSNTTSSIYSNVQPTGKAVDKDINVIYADPNEV